MKRIVKACLLLMFLLADAGIAFAVEYYTAPSRIPATGETNGVAGSASGVEWPDSRFESATGVTDGCITDKLTGLMWPKNGIISFKNASGVLLDQPIYDGTNENLNRLVYLNNIINAIKKMNSATNKLCGFSDWRVPNIVELQSLVNYSVSKSPADWLQTKGFSRIGTSGSYWSSTDNPAQRKLVWCVYFSNGVVYSDGDEAFSSYLLPVRGGQQQ